MLIVTPAFGSMPEPRPQQLITGDRALQLLDTQSSAALQAAGVKVATVSKTSYDNLVATLTPEVFAGLDPVTGKLLDGVMPDRLSASSIAALNLLDINGTVAVNYLPSYLTPTGLTSTIAGTSAVQLDTDPDGTPVVLGATPLTSNLTFTGTATANTFTAGTVHGDLITGTVATITSVESNQTLFDNQSTQPAAGSASQTKLYANGNSRLSWIDSAGSVYLVANKRIVTSWPTAINSQLGDEAIISATGEHRIYKGSLGWRLASPHTVPDLATRNAITSPYAGMRVFVQSGIGQDHVYRADGVWHGTEPIFISGGAPQLQNNVNDTNFRLWNSTDIADPGYPYRIQGRLDMEVVQLGSAKGRIEIWVSTADLTTGLNPQSFLVAYQDPSSNFCLHWDMAPLSPQITGGKKVLVTWRCRANGANAYSGNYQSYNDWQLIPV